MPLPDVAQILRHYPPDCQPARIESLGSAGGMSGAQFWQVQTRRETLCLRRWPIEHPSPRRLTLIHAVLQHAAGRGISFIPLPITTDVGESFVQHAGHLWQLEPWMRGIADYERTPRIEKLRAAMTALAQFHVATRDFGAAIRGDRKIEAMPDSRQSAILRHLARLRELARQGITALSHAIDDAVWPELAPLARQFIALLPNALPAAIAQFEPLSAAPLPLQPCLRDVWQDHILFTGDEVTGIVDFGALDLDTPATDIARLLGSFVADDLTNWQSGLAAYSSARPLSPEESLAVFALDKSGTVLAGCNWIRWIYVERRKFENRQQVTDRFRRIVTRASLSPPKT